MCGNKKYVYICSPKTTVLDRESGRKPSSRDRKGEVPEWSIGPHSKCGVRATVPGVRIPPSPLKSGHPSGRINTKSCKFNDLQDFFYSCQAPKSKKTRYTASQLLTVHSTPASASSFRRSGRSTVRFAPTGPSAPSPEASPTTSTFPKPLSQPPRPEFRRPMPPTRVFR